MVDQRQRGKPKSPTATAHGFAIDQQKQQRQRQRIKTVANGFVLLVLVFVFVFVTPIFVPTRESFYDFCVQRKLGSRGVSGLGKYLQPESHLCSKNMIYDSYGILATMKVNESVFVGFGKNFWVKVPYVVDTALLRVLRVNKQLFSLYAFGAFAVALMKIMRKIMLLIKLCFAVVALKLLTGETFKVVILTLVAQAVGAFLLAKKFPVIKTFTFPKKRGRSQQHSR